MSDEWPSPYGLNHVRGPVNSRSLPSCYLLLPTGVTCRSRPERHHFFKRAHGSIQHECRHQAVCMHSLHRLYIQRTTDLVHYCHLSPELGYKAAWREYCQSQGR